MFLTPSSLPLLYREEPRIIRFSFTGTQQYPTLTLKLHFGFCDEFGFHEVIIFNTKEDFSEFVDRITICRCNRCSTAMIEAILNDSLDEAVIIWRKNFES